ncbi:MAG: hypothetical protein JXD18_03895 [Anaerolineae bacterium]|nr:hypothetical protein [Anaerolineae bacterium]
MLRFKGKRIPPLGILIAILIVGIVVAVVAGGEGNLLGTAGVPTREPLPVDDTPVAVVPELAPTVSPTAPIEEPTAEPTEDASAAAPPQPTIPPQPVEPEPTPTPTPDASVQPLLECVVDNGNGSYTAFFSYRNDGAEPIAIPVSGDNQLSPGPADQGQPTVFAPGQAGAWPGAPVAVVFGAGEVASWTLGGHTTSASSDSPICAYRVYFDVQWYDAAGQPMEGPPADLSADYAIAAESELGTARCAYAGGSSQLVCAYANHSPARNNDGLWTTPNTAYAVEQTGLLQGWTSFAGTGAFPAISGSGSFVHLVSNHVAGAPAPSPTPTQPSPRPTQPPAGGTPVAQVTATPASPAGEGAATAAPPAPGSTPVAVAAAPVDAETILPASGGRSGSFVLGSFLLGGGLTLICTGLILGWKYRS